ncbi:TPA: hypothetical protein DCX15_01770 [bacterium]|nr:hypothetical protein [bacterium]
MSKSERRVLWKPLSSKKTSIVELSLYAKSMFVCIMDAKGDIVFQRNMLNDPSYFLKVVEPYRKEIVVGVESTLNWYWLADTCQGENISFFLGHALYMKAVHGGKTKNDRIDSRTIANLLT